MYAQQTHMQSFPKNPYAVKQHKLRKWKNQGQQEVYDAAQVEEVETVQDDSKISTLSLVGTIVGLSALVIGTTLLLKNKHDKGTESLGETSASEDDTDDGISAAWKNSMAKFRNKLQERLPVEHVEEEEEEVRGAQPTYVEERSTTIQHPTKTKKGKKVKKTTYVKEKSLVDEPVQKPKKSKFKTLFA